MAKTKDDVLKKLKEESMKELIDKRVYVIESVLRRFETNLEASNLHDYIDLSKLQKSLIRDDDLIPPQSFKFVFEDFPTTPPAASHVDNTNDDVDSDDSSFQQSTTQDKKLPVGTIIVDKYSDFDTKYSDIDLMFAD